MAGPRSLSRSTTVTASAGSSKRKGNKKHQQRKGKRGGDKQLATWDHDNSSGEENEDDSGGLDGNPEPITTPGQAQAALSKGSGKKRPRTQAGVLDKHDTLDEQSSVSKRSRPVTSGDPEGVHGSESASEEEGSEEGREDEPEDGGEEPTVAAKGGMGDVMAKILGQKLDDRVQAPVLAKRKTKAMKEMEQASVKRAETRGRSAVRRANFTQQFVIPDHTTTDYERQLKKIATRGVVALFNAISKRQTQETGGGNANNHTAAKNIVGTGAVKGASRHAFLDMLKTGVKPGSAPAAAGRGAEGSRGGGREVEVVRSSQEEGGRSWSVLKEDYMMGASSMKNWDQDSAESEVDALGGLDAMSDDDSD